MAPSARVLRQLIVNACSLSDVAFTLLASFRGLAVSPCASFERLTLYHSRAIKQAKIISNGFSIASRFAMHRAPLREPPPLLRRNIFARAVADGKLFTGAGRFVVDRNRRYVRIRLHLRLVFLGQFVKSPGHRLSRTYPSIQAVLSDSHIGDFCPRGADFREEGVLRSKARAARPSAGPRVPPPRRLARSREPPSCYWLARAG